MRLRHDLVLWFAFEPNQSLPTTVFDYVSVSLDFDTTAQHNCILRSIGSVLCWGYGKKVAGTDYERKDGRCKLIFQITVFHKRVFHLSIR